MICAMFSGAQEIPFFAADSASSTPALPTRGLAFWWVASDLTNSPVQIWQDRIQGRNLVQATAANQPSWTNNLGVNFTGNQFMDLTNTIPLLINSAWMVVVRPMTNNAQYEGIIFAGASFNLLFFNFFAGASQFLYGDSTQVIGEIALNKNYEFMYAGTNGPSITLIYTNGVQASSVSFTSGTMQRIGNDTTHTYYLNGRIQEIAIWTNVSILTPSEISQAYQHVTNSWIFP